MTEPILDVVGLSLSFGALPILQDVQFSLAPGEIIALTGESGSGKSMTALTIMGLQPKGAHLKGQIYLGTRELTTLPEAELCQIRGRDIGMVFQEPMTALNPLLSIGAQVAEGLRLHRGMNRVTAQNEASKLLARVGLPPEVVSPDRFPHQLSGGQRQRVVIAMAIALRPKLLIADEPTTALDVTTQAEILHLLQDLVRSEGMAMVIITHDLAVVANLADRLVVMRNGEVVERGATEAVLTHRRHPYTQSLCDASRHQVALQPPPPPEPILELRNVSCSYGGRGKFLGRGKPKPAVKNVSLTLNRGERLGLVGESGCGKSTLTRAILGLEPLAAGEIHLKGKALSAKRSAEARRAIQVVFQDPFGSFNPRHTVARLVSEPFFAHPNPPDGTRLRAEVEAMLQDVGLSASDAEKYIHQFSGGQRQRIAIARALITRPELVILDEAVSALDVSVRAQILDLLADLCNRYGLTYLFISHDLSVVRGVTDRTLVMKGGEIVEEGPTQVVFDTPQHPYTKALLAAAPVLPDFDRGAA